MNGQLALDKNFVRLYVFNISETFLKPFENILSV